MRKMSSCFGKTTDPVNTFYGPNSRVGIAMFGDQPSSDTLNNLMLQTQKSINLYSTVDPSPHRRKPSNPIRLGNTVLIGDTSALQIGIVPSECEDSTDSDKGEEKSKIATPVPAREVKKAPTMLKFN